LSADFIGRVSYKNRSADKIDRLSSALHYWANALQLCHKGEKQRKTAVFTVKSHFAWLRENCQRQSCNAFIGLYTGWPKKTAHFFGFCFFLMTTLFASQLLQWNTNILTMLSNKLYFALWCQLLCHCYCYCSYDL